MTQPFRVLSWGGGLQSTALGEMSAQGILPRLDLIVFCDLGWEMPWTADVIKFYSHRWQLEGIDVRTIKTGNIKDEGGNKHVHVPLWTASGAPLRRQCTRNFKIRPAHRLIREHLGYFPSKPPNPPAGSAEQWLGFSLDERQRATPSSLQYITNRWPLLEMNYARWMLPPLFEQWGLPIPRKSACVCCPNRRASEWLYVRRHWPEVFESACQWDEKHRYNMVRELGLESGAVYLYKDANDIPAPLREADLEADMMHEHQITAAQMLFGVPLCQ